MKTTKKFLLLAALIGTICTGYSPAAALNPGDQGHVLVPESSGFKASDHQTMLQHTRMRLLAMPNAATPALYAQLNTPQKIRAAYNLPSTGGSQAIAIVDAYHYPTSTNDFNAFSATFGLPQELSRNPNAINNAHFSVVYATGKVPQSGGAYIESWNLEEALDIEWAHAMAPNAKIYLVEAASASLNDLMTAVRVASSLPGVKEVSMSWGGGEAPWETWYSDPVFNRNGVVYFASGGDSSDAMEYPAASPYVVACGGTTMNRASDGSLVNESAWADTGCGPSSFERRPAFQDRVASVVGSTRGVADLSFVADPNTGVYVYDSTPMWGTRGWFILGGTSVSSPALAGVVNLAASINGFAANTAAEEARIYGNLGNANAFNDVTSGTDGCYSSTTGYDFVTGVGTPNGLVGK
jgi:subtilase family serine protease